MPIVQDLTDRLRRYRRRVKEPKRAEIEDHIPSQLAKFKFWAPIYDPFFRIQTIGRTHHVRDAVLNRVDAGDRKILEVCCGTASISNALAGRYPDAEIIGLDISPHMLAKARRKVARAGHKNISFVEGDARQIPFPDDHFDAVINTFGLHEMPVKIMHEAVNEMSRVLKDGRKMVVMDYQRPTFLPVRLFFDFIMYVWEPRGTFLYCNNRGIIDCLSNCMNGENCLNGSSVDDFKTQKCWRTSAVLMGTKSNGSHQNGSKT